MTEGNTVKSNYELASRTMRVLSSILDLLVTVCAILVSVFLLSKLGIAAELVALKPSVEYNLLITGISFAIFMLLQGYSLIKYSQTIGKLATNIRIVGSDNNPINAFKLITMRYASLFAISAIPTAGGLIVLIGYLLIFTEERRCLHDLLAGTKVVDLNSLTSQGSIREERETA